MNTSRSWLTGLMVVGLLAALTVGLAGLLNRGAATEQTAQGGSAAPEQQAPTPTLQAAIVFGGSDATWTPFPTFPPPPTPTLDSGFVATPIPLAIPAPNPAGVLYYAELVSRDELVVNSLTFDKEGTIIDLPEIVGKLPGRSMFTSNDGSRIITEDGWGNHYLLFTESQKIQPLFEETLNVRGLFFSWHPDNRHILMRAESNYPDVGLWLLDSDSKKHTTLLNQSPSPQIAGGAISSDGMYVIYSPHADFFTPYELWKTTVYGREHHLIHESDGIVSTIRWSPDNTKIAFFDGGLMIMEPDGSDFRLLSSNVLNGQGIAPVWSPDSRYVAYVGASETENRSPEESDELRPEWKEFLTSFEDTSIYLGDVSTGESLSPIGDIFAGAIDPAWSPDGSLLAFSSFSDGKAMIWLMNSDGNNLRQLTTSDYPIRFLSWHTSSTPSALQP